VTRSADKSLLLPLRFLLSHFLLHSAAGERLLSSVQFDRWGGFRVFVRVVEEPLGVVRPSPEEPME
jgi:hypothetical protein